jgi:hypothetical protein
MLASSQSRTSGNTERVRPGKDSTFVADLVDRQAARHWDTIDFEAGVILPHYVFFDIPLGAIGLNGNSKSLFDTNLECSRRLPPPRCFSLHRIVFTFNKKSVPEDVSSAIDNFIFRFKVGDKYFASSPICHMQTVKVPLSPIRICDFCRAVFVERLECPGCGARSFKLSSLGDFDSGQQFVMDLEPKFIPPLTHFCVELLVAPNLHFKAPLRTWCTFEGFSYLPVQ